MAKVFNLNRDNAKELGAVRYIGRGYGSKWANPFPLTSSGRVICLAKYLDHCLKTNLWRDIHELRGQDLLCFCDPELCHGHLLVHLSERENLDEEYVRALRDLAYRKPDDFIAVIRGQKEKTVTGQSAHCSQSGKA